MKLINIIFALALFASFGFAQNGNTNFDGNQKHTIVYERGFFSNTYKVDGQEVDQDVEEQLLLYVPEANDKWNTGDVFRYASWGIAFAGGFMVGYGAVQSQSLDEDVESQYKMPLTIGAVLIVTGIILEKVGNSKKDGAIEIYNSESGKQAESTTSFNIQVAPTTQGGVG